MITAGYHNQLNCKRCGYCCTLSPKLTKSDIQQIKKLGYTEDFFVDSSSDFKSMKLINNNCVFLDAKENKPVCIIYSSRPAACRIYPSYDKDIKECPPKKSIIKDIADKTRKEIESNKKPEKTKLNKPIQS